MKNTLSKANGSTFLVTVELSQHDQDNLHQKTLQSLQGEVKIPGFRPGHVPLHMVEKQIQPQYLKMGFMEEAINASIKAILKEHGDKKFIGQPYDINEDKKSDTLIITYKIDAYPEAEAKNNDWKKLSISPIDTAVSKDEIEKAMLNLQRQYADYKDVDAVAKNTLVKAKYSMQDKDGNELHTGTAFFGEEEFNESPFLLEVTEGKKKGETFEFPYKEKDLPHAVHYHPHGDETAKKIKTVVMTLSDVKETMLPDLHDGATLQRLFQSPDINTFDDLTGKISTVLGEQKEEMGLQQAIENMLGEAKNSITVEVPETILREEMAARVKQLGDRMGGEEGLKQYFAKIGEEKVTQLYDDVRKSASESLEKFFIMRKLVELLEISDINWENQLDAEKKLYARLVSGDAPKKAAKKTTKAESADDEETTEKPKAKRATKKKTDE